MTYSTEAALLDDTILGVIRTWRERGEPLPEAEFDRLALDIFAHQLRYNQPYARYCAAFGIGLGSLPDSWRAIPPVPAAAYKEAILCTFDSRRAELVFETSGTTRGTGGKHYMEKRTLYDAALLAGFERLMLAGTRQRLRYLLLVPNPKVQPGSSLGYMMREAAHVFGDGAERWYLDSERLDVTGFLADAAELTPSDGPVFVAGTAFALAEIVSAARERGISSIPLPPGSLVMETGGFKGRTRVIGREDFYRDLTALFAQPNNRVVAEYGMTELTSQYYDDVTMLLPGGTVRGRIKVAPPWLRSLVVDAAGHSVADGVVGSLVHVDLANRSSCAAVATEDLGARVPGGIVLLGRDEGASLRGCSLDAEALAARVHAS